MFENIKMATAKTPPDPNLLADLDETTAAPGASLEALTSAAEPEADAVCDKDPLAPKGPDALPVRFGSVQVKLSAPNGFPHLVEKLQDTTVIGYDVFLFDDIYYSRSESRPIQHLVQLLDHATEDQVFTIYIASRGGQISAMAAIVSAMQRTRARVITIAVGAVMSAATVVWWAGHERKIYPGALFMFHFSSHGDYGTSRGIKQRAAALIRYVQEKLLDPMVADRLLTDMEMSTILAGEDVLIPASVMAERLAMSVTAELPVATEPPLAQQEASADAQETEAEALPPADETQTTEETE